MLNGDLPGFFFGGSGGGNKGLYTNAQTRMKLRISAKSRRVIGSPCAFTKYSNPGGSIIVNMLEPAVTNPLTFPKYLLK